LSSATSFGVTRAHIPDGRPTIELTTDPAIHGLHGAVNVRCTTEQIPICGNAADGVACDAPAGTSFSAQLAFAERGWVRCVSEDAMRFWGRFDPNADLIVGSIGDVRLIARTPRGDVLAGPITLSPGAPPTSLVW